MFVLAGLLRTCGARRLVVLPGPRSVFKAEEPHEIDSKHIKMFLTQDYGLLTNFAVKDPLFMVKNCPKNGVFGSEKSLFVAKSWR